MSTLSLATPPSFDYTSRDFQSIREDLISLVQQRYPAWNPTNAADFGVVLVEAFALVGDNLSYYLDRIANESSILTAVQPETVYALADLMGYIPALGFPAAVSLTFTNGSGSTQVIPEGTVLQAAVNSGTSTTLVNFETDVSLTLAAGVSDIVTATQGLTSRGSGTGVVLGLSTGQPSQRLLLPSAPVVQNSIRIIVNDGTTDVEWEAVQSLADWGPTDQVFSITPGVSSQATVVFGDGTYGAIPTTNYTIKCIYAVGGGQVGNVAANSTWTAPAGLPALVTVANLSAAVGGADPEPLSSIRANAPRANQALRRAVTTGDLASVALSMPDVSKAAGQVDLWSHPTVYIAPGDDGTPTPGVVSGSPTATLTGILTSAQSLIQRYAMAGTTVAVAAPTYVPFTVKVTVTLKPTAIQSVAKAAIEAAVQSLYSFSNSEFGASINASDVVVAIADLGWGTATTVTDIYRNDSGFSSGVHTTTALTGELLTLATTDLTVTVSGGIVG